MTTGLYFSSLFNTVAHGHAQTSFYGGSRKRKRDDDVQPHDEDEPADHATHSGVLEEQLDTDANAAAALDLDDTQSDSENNLDFRVWSKPATSRSIAPSKLEQKLADLKPPLCLGLNHHTGNSSGPRQPGLKQQHLAVLTTIMHKCLLKGDYMRAARAWGLLLHAEINGRPPALRSCGLWSLGAEILLQNDPKARIVPGKYTKDLEWDATSYTGNESEEEYGHLTLARSTQAGFKQTKAYFERLILQYPWRKWLRHSVSSLHFYPVMFSHWISVVQDQHCHALARLSYGSEGSGEGPKNPSDEDEKSRQVRKDAIRLTTLHSAEEIFEDLRKLLDSFPYSDHASLWTLKGKVALWLSDLCLPRSTQNLETGTFGTGESNANSSARGCTRSIEYDGSIEGRRAGGDWRHISEEHNKYEEEAAEAFETARKFQKRMGDGTGDYLTEDDTVHVEQETQSISNYSM